MTDNNARLRWGRIVGFGLLAEVATAVVIIATLAVHSRVIAAGQQAAIDDFAQRAPALLGPVFGVLFTLLAAVQVTRPLTDRFRLHGALVGVVTGLLTIPGLLAGAPSMRPIYGLALVLKVAAGVLGGILSESRYTNRESA